MFWDTFIQQSDLWVTRGLIILLTLLITFLVAKVAGRLLERSLKRSSRIMHVDHTHYHFFRRFLIWVIYTIGIAIALQNIPVLQTFSTSIFAGAGVLAVVVGLASQQAFSNIVSGVFIAVSKPLKVGDSIKLQGRPEIHGYVEDITLRHTVIRNFENKRFIVPNSVINTEIIENEHYHDERIRKFIDFSIGYDSSIDKAMNIMREEILKHPFFLDRRSDKEKLKKKGATVPIRVISFGESGVNLRAWAWAKNPKEAFKMGCDLNKNIKERFDREGIEIPYPYRTLVFKNKPKLK